MAFKGWMLLLGGLVVAAVAAAVLLLVLPESVEAISVRWEESTHANAESLAFTFWEEQGLGDVPRRCARCHSTPGNRDFLGADGTAAGTVEEAPERGSVINCSACHNPPAHELSRVSYPSGIAIDDLGASAVCHVCHQGRRAGEDVRQMTEGIEPDDTSPDLVFINVHYYIAASTWLGGEVEVGYQYPDRTYVDRYEHVPDMQRCVECHNPHSQTVDPDKCSPCHVTVVDRGDLSGIRIDETDYDGDGTVEEEGLGGEIETMQERLYAAMQTYASQELTPLVYADRSPYFFIDSDGDGEADEDEIDDRNAYRTWTPRLLRAAYNYHFSQQDPGNYAHNARYVIQLLYDSLADLGEQIPVELEPLVRPEPYEN